MKIKKYFASIAVICALIGLTFPASAQEKAKATAKTGKTVIATVNGTEITKDAYDYFFTQITRGAPINDPAKRAEIKKSIMEQLLMQELFFAESGKKNIKIDNAEVDKQVAEIKKMHPDKGSFAKLLETMNMTEAFLKYILERNMAIDALIKQEITSKITISDKEITDFYAQNPKASESPEMVRASHILAKIDPGASEAKKGEALKKIQGLQKRLKKGEKFEDLAKENSDCPSGKDGGDLNFFAKEQMAPPFSKAAFALKPGEISDIVETRFGYHLIKMTEKKEASVVPLGDIKDKISQFLAQQKNIAEIKAYAAALKKKATIKIMN